MAFPSIRRMQVLTGYAILAGMSSVAILAFVLNSPKFRSMFGASNKVQSAMNLHAIGLVMRKYADDHGGEYPDSFETILLNEPVTSTVFVLPSRGESPASAATTRATADQMMCVATYPMCILEKGCQ
jgi:hypothetical protein